MPSLSQTDDFQHPMCIYSHVHGIGILSHLISYIQSNVFYKYGDQLNSKLKTALKKDIPAAIMYRYLTIRSFVDYLNREKGDEVSAGGNPDIDESIRLMEETNQLLSIPEEETEEAND